MAIEKIPASQPIPESHPQTKGEQEGAKKGPMGHPSKDQVYKGQKEQPTPMPTPAQPERMSIAAIVDMIEQAKAEGRRAAAESDITYAGVRAELEYAITLRGADYWARVDQAISDWNEIINAVPGFDEIVDRIIELEKEIGELVEMLQERHAEYLEAVKEFNEAIAKLAEDYANAETPEERARAVDEFRQAVEKYNEAVDRYLTDEVKELIDHYNFLVKEYNQMVEELNAALDEINQGREPGGTPPPLGEDFYRTPLTPINYPEAPPASPIIEPGAPGSIVIPEPIAPPPPWNPQLDSPAHLPYAELYALYGLGGLTSKDLRAMLAELIGKEVREAEGLPSWLLQLLERQEKILALAEVLGEKRKDQLKQLAHQGTLFLLGTIDAGTTLSQGVITAFDHPAVNSAAATTVIAAETVKEAVAVLPKEQEKIAMQLIQASLLLAGVGAATGSSQTITLFNSVIEATSDHGDQAAWGTLQGELDTLVAVYGEEKVTRALQETFAAIAPEVAPALARHVATEGLYPTAIMQVLPEGTPAQVGEKLIDASARLVGSAASLFALRSGLAKNMQPALLEPVALHVNASLFGIRTDLADEGQVVTSSSNSAAEQVREALGRLDTRSRENAKENFRQAHEESQDLGKFLVKLMDPGQQLQRYGLMYEGGYAAQDAPDMRI